MRTTDGGESWKDCSDDLIRLAQKPHLKSKIVSDTSDEACSTATRSPSARPIRMR